MSIEIVKECTLEFYNDITLLDENKNVYLVQNQITGLVFAKKIIKTYNIDVYKNLKNHSHKNISKIYELIEIDNELILIEEFINGRNLEQLINEVGKLNEKIAIEYIYQILDGLDYIHNLNPPIIHRDIKLSNIMINNDGIIKIIDFNTSRLYDKHDSRDTVIMGTAGYAAPEQYGFTQTDCRSDIYALGVLVNYMLTGKHPHDELHKGKYKNIIEKCIHLSPDLRFNNIRQLRNAFDKKTMGIRTTNQKQSAWLIPGFRTNKIWKMIVAILGYFFILYAALTTEHTDMNLVENIIENVIIFIMSLVLIALYTNYLNIQQYLPLCRSNKYLFRIIGCILFTFVIVFIAAFLSVIFTSA